MREIKFRAWFRGDIMKWDDDIEEGERMFDWEHITDYEGLEHYLYESDYEVMQFTGIKDKTGKLIYEGDILETDLSRPYLVVEFKNGAFMYNCHDDGNDYYDYMGAADENIKQDKFLEVIGNIYENPQLLEEEI